MDIRHIRYLLAICDERSFTRAAKRCGVAQPSLSNAVKKLEAEIGSTLFVRAKNGHPETIPTNLMLDIKTDLERAIASLDQVYETVAKLHRKSPDKDVGKGQTQ